MAKGAYVRQKYPLLRPPSRIWCLLCGSGSRSVELIKERALRLPLAFHLPY